MEFMPVGYELEETTLYTRDFIINYFIHVKNQTFPTNKKPPFKAHVRFNMTAGKIPRNYKSCEHVPRENKWLQIPLLVFLDEKYLKRQCKRYAQKTKTKNNFSKVKAMFEDAIVNMLDAEQYTFSEVDSNVDLLININDNYCGWRTNTSTGKTDYYGRYAESYFYRNYFHKKNRYFLGADIIQVSVESFIKMVVEHPSMLAIMAYAVYSQSDLLRVNARMSTIKMDIGFADNFRQLAERDPLLTFSLASSVISEHKKEKTMYSVEDAQKKIKKFLSEQNDMKVAESIAPIYTSYPLLLCGIHTPEKEMNSLAAVKVFLDVFSDSESPHTIELVGAHTLISAKVENDIVFREKKLCNLPAFYNRNNPLVINNRLLSKLLRCQHMLYPFTVTSNLHVSPSADEAYLNQIIYIDLDDVPVALSKNRAFKKARKTWLTLLALYIFALQSFEYNGYQSPHSYLRFNYLQPDSRHKKLSRGQQVLVEHLCSFMFYLSNDGFIKEDSGKKCIELLTDVFLAQNGYANNLKSIERLDKQIIRFIKEHAYAEEYVVGNNYWVGKERNQNIECYYIKHSAFYQDFCQFFDSNATNGEINKNLKKLGILLAPTSGALGKSKKPPNASESIYVLCFNKSEVDRIHADECN